MTDRDTRILGVDPGSRITGFGVIETRGGGYTYVASGCITARGETLAERLRTLFTGMEEVVGEYAPAVMAVERVFVQHNVDSALKLGQARGAVICAGALQSLPVHEYTPAEIKKAIVGKGNADKAQIQHMAKVLLNLRGTLSTDAGDALACALCHAHLARSRERMGPHRQAVTAGSR